jgi:Uma2 family endonuclease
MGMPTVKRRWTVEDLQDLPDDGNRYEVIDGELFVTPAPTWRHQDAVLRMSRMIANHLEREHVGHVVISPADVVFSRTRAVQPDFFVVPLADGRPPERFEDVGRLLLAVEVLSPSTTRTDRVEKRSLYRTEAVPEYWVVDMDSRTIERSTPADPRVEVLAERLEWLPTGATSALAIDVVEYFAKILGER